MANKSVVNAAGMIKDVLVQVNDLAFPVDFVVIDIDLANEKDIILGRPFLATSQACIDMKKGEVTIKMNEEERTHKVYNKMSYHCYRAEVRDKKDRPSTSLEEEEDPKEDPEEESAEPGFTPVIELDDETDMEDEEDYVEENYLRRVAYELTDTLDYMHKCCTDSLRVIRNTLKEGIDRMNMELDSRGPDEAERRWHTSLHMLGTEVNSSNGPA
ncbi:hypothetical protein A2U01_0031736, partial [Trifolium medium]|nr:hypothetical protein [Trifolium medium]